MLSARTLHKPDTGAYGRWAACASVVLLLHLAAAWQLAHQNREAPEPLIPAAIPLELAPEPVAPPPSPSPPVPAATPALPEPAAPPDTPPPPPIPEPVVPPAPAPAADAPLPKPSPPVVRSHPPPQKHPVVRQPHPSQRPEEPPRPATAAAPVEAAPAPNQAPMTWQNALRAHIALFKRYPVLAQRRGEQGVAQVRFLMDRAGRLLSVALVQGSGHADLDQEALAWIQRAQPLPPPPPDMGQGPIELTIPLRFELK